MTEEPAKWTLEDGIMTVGRGDIVTRYEFGDTRIHLEFREPDMPDHGEQGKRATAVYMSTAARRFRFSTPMALENPPMAIALPFTACMHR